MALLSLPGPRVVCCVLLMAGAVAYAQTSPQGQEPVKAASAESERNSDSQQQRRASLRATLKSMPEGAGKAQRLAVSERQLSAQERADLRQQLRQQ